MAKKNDAHNAKSADAVNAENSKTLADNEKSVETEAVKEEEKDAGQSAELQNALSAAEDYKRKWYTVSAEYDNFRKRNAQAVSAAYRDGSAEAVLKFLPVADNFGYAYDSANDEKTKTGIDKVIKSFATVLSSLGIEEIKINAGDPFDESVAEAIMNFPCGENEQPNTVKQVIKKGYKSGDKVIRFAQVSVTVK